METVTEKLQLSPMQRRLLALDVSIQIERHEREAQAAIRLTLATLNVAATDIENIFREAEELAHTL